METKKCSKCLKEKFILEFYKQLGKPRARCKVCLQEARLIYDKSEGGKIVQMKASIKYRKSDKYWDNYSNLYIRAKASAKQHKRDFLISKEEYNNLISKPCYYCNDILNNEKNRGIGLDRIDNSKGYEINNIIRCCGFCNKTKGDRLSVDEMKKVAEFIISLRKIQ